MKDEAKKLAGYGRYGDDMLLHVSREELEGIRSITGKNFTRNPVTGLPEAFEFTDLIPAIAGVLGTVLTGNPVVGAAAAGASSAAKTGVEGGSFQDALLSGAISGIGSYAGSSLLSGVGDLGKTAATEAATQGLGQLTAAGQDLGVSALTAPVAAIGDTLPTASLAALSPMPAAEGIGAIAGQAASGAGQGAADGIGAIAGQVKSQIPSQGFASNLATNIGDFGTRLSNIASDPSRSVGQLASNLQANPTSALIAGGSMLAPIMSANTGMPTEEEDSKRYPEQFPANPRRFVAPPSGYVPGTSPQYRYFAEGGLASLRDEGSHTANLVNEAKAALLGEHPRPRDAINRFKETFGDDALALLSDRISGGRVRGAGSGMDDLVPGTIEGRQQVRLADGEFVIPAPVVSALGDGSTDHGSRKLQEMVNSVYRQTYKTDRLPDRVKNGTMPHER